MTPQAQAIWSALTFRTPMFLRNVEPLSEAQMHWAPPGRSSVAWQVWHIAEAEDNWVRTLVLEQPPHFPFGVQMRQAEREQYPDKVALLDYFREARELSRARLEATSDADFERLVDDADFGHMPVRGVWAGVVTSFAWHAGQTAMTAKMMPESPVTTMEFGYWKEGGEKGCLSRSGPAADASTGDFMDQSILHRLLGHNIWATRVLLEHCRPLTDAQLGQPFEIGPGTVYDTLLHTIGAIQRWADRIGGGDLRPSPEDGPGRHTIDELMRLLAGAGADLEAAAQRVTTEGRLGERMEFLVTGREEPYRFTRGTALVHVVTHGVHHRAQVLNMLRQLGVPDLPELDAVEWELAASAEPPQS